MKKIIYMALCASLCFNSYAETDFTDEYLWSQQEAYLMNMKVLQDGIQEVSDKLELCRYEYYKNTTLEEKNDYLKATTDYSTSLLVTKTILTQSINDLEMKMVDQKEMVLKNLKEYESGLVDLVEREKLRNDGLLIGFNNNFKEVKSIYCPKM